MVEYSKGFPGGPGEPPVNLTKVTLTKQAPAVSLTKQGSASGTMRVNLNWESGASAGGWRSKMGGKSAIDLDLGCLYELTDGTKGAIQAVGKLFGSLDQRPFIMLDGDDRSGDTEGGENLLINLAHIAEIRRILVFAFIYQGAPSWDKAQGVVTLHPNGGPQVEVKVDEKAGGARLCAIALLQNSGNDLTVQREVRYIANHQAMDQAYGWGMRWAASSK